MSTSKFYDVRMIHEESGDLKEIQVEALGELNTEELVEILHQVGYQVEEIKEIESKLQDDMPEMQPRNLH